MVYLGAHESISGGLHHAIEDVEKVGGEALQLFTRNQRQWKAAPLSDQDISLFREKREQFEYLPIASHASYLINLASSKPDLVIKSIQAFTDELIRCSQLQLQWVVIHPGSHGGAGIDKGLENIVNNLDKVFEQSEKSVDVQVLLETTAGQGTGLGSTFEELAWIISNSAFRERLGICVDTCHIFAAGYDIRSRKSYEATFFQLESCLDIGQIGFFHLNDSKKELGSRVDRHEHIGKGHIGLDGFRYLLSDPRFQDYPMTLETPKGKDLEEDRENLATLRSLLEN